MPKMLRHVTTREIWPYNPNMARHPDVEIFDQPDPQITAAVAANAEATIGDVMELGSDEPVVTEDHEFEDVPDFEEVAEEGAPVEEATAPEPDPQADSEAVLAQKAAVKAAAKKAAAATRRKAAAAKKKAEALAAAEAEAEEDEDEDDDLDLDDFDE